MLKKEESNKIVKTVEICSVIPDSKFQPRAKLNQEVIEEYKDHIINGGTFPPIIVIDLGDENYSIVAGFHRYEAYKKAELEYVSIEIKALDDQEALIEAVTSNTKHGIRYTNQDKHRCVEKLLNDSDIRNWADNRIAKTCSVSNHFVKGVREKLNLFPDSDHVEYERNGKIQKLKKSKKMVKKRLSGQDLLRDIHKILNHKTYEITAIFKVIRDSHKAPDVEIPEDIKSEIEAFVAWYEENKEVASCL